MPHALVTIGSLRSQVSGKTFVSIIPEIDYTWCFRDSYHTLRNQFRDSLGIVGDGPGKSAIELHDQLSLCVASRTKSSDVISQMRTFASPLEMERELRRNSHNGDFKSRTGSGWFGNDNYFEGGYLCCSASDVDRLKRRLYDWLAVNVIYGLPALLFFWQQIIAIHPFVDGNGRFGRVATIAMAESSLDRLILGGLWTLYCRGYARVVSGVHAAVAICDPIAFLREFLSMWTECGKHDVLMRLNRLRLLERTLGPIARRMCSGLEISAEDGSQILGRSRRRMISEFEMLVEQKIILKCDSNRYSLTEFTS